MQKLLFKRKNYLISTFNVLGLCFHVYTIYQVQDAVRECPV